MPKQVDDGWQTGSLVDADINPVRISYMLEYIYPGYRGGETFRSSNGVLKFLEIHSILIVKNDKLVFEEYFYDYDREKKHNTASVTKSITSLLVGLAIEQGYLTGVEEKILPYFPEYLPLQTPNEYKESITIEDMLTMRHGMNCDDWDPNLPTHHLVGYPFYESDVIAATLNFAMVAQPGSHYAYCSASTVLLGSALSKAVGMGIPAFARRNLFDPLGIQFTKWHKLARGVADTAGSMEMRPRDMAKIGLLMLHNGNWNGKQIIPEDWIRQSIQEHVSLGFNQTWGKGYGYLWWLSDVVIRGTNVHSFAASGAGGQVIVVFPELDMVIVITGGNYLDDEGQPFQIMEKFILPAALAD